MKRSVFCSMYPDRCFEPSAEFCTKWRSYCGSNKTLIPKKDYYEVEDTMDFEDILKYGDNLDELVVFNKSSVKTGEITGPYLRLKKEESGAMVCYSLHSVAESHDVPKTQTRSQFSFTKESTAKLIFYIEEDEMFIPGNLPGVLFSVHSPFQTVNPFQKGIFMKPGRNYILYVTMEQEILLKEPFQPTCVDYEEIWEANNRTGPRIQEMCLHKCFLDLSMACFNCCVPFILYPTQERLCSRGEIDMDNRLCTDQDFESAEECTRKCKDDCRVTKYFSELMERYEVDHVETDDPQEFRRYITVEVYLEDGEIVILQHSPKYISVEVFSAIGGFVGVWLGISFMDVIDAIASAFSVCRYAIRK